MTLALLAFSLGINVMFLTRDFAASMKDSGSAGIATTSGVLCWMACLWAALEFMFVWLN